jgi:hypothetical protein
MKALRMRQSARKGSVATGFILMELNTHTSSECGLFLFLNLETPTQVINVTTMARRKTDIEW